MIVYTALVTFALLAFVVRFGIFGFYAAAVPILTLLGAYEFFTGKQSLLDAGAALDPALIGLLGLSGLDWMEIAGLAWLGLAVCIFLIKSGLVGKHGIFSQRLMCGPWF